ncbi:MAG: chromosome segregation protein SMC [Halofilum sp. (in: g-proteobacteria)]|nr:chromosome segregation protein SMC [Halofilum sp. (in: g-proteobacteria)]
MRLTKIKLAGFKSFVDPTTVQFPSNLVGVVGPNGCGKSNVIDAVRWVMGESSAKHLRGGTMDDVIFNGSSARKPVGQASVELIFDNADGSLGGEYAQYNEISIKRVVNRESQSAYYLNGTRCRRRDITDIFLGTGLGPRSYAIIEQGMISRLIEARPEDMRVYLEEAAGISKYKERRRETENRIRHTRENLDRLNDLREEVGKHLEHLARQKRTAERYREYRQAERQAQAELLALKWRDMEQQLEARQRSLNAEQTRLEEVVARQRKAESDLEQAREQHHEATEAFNEVQGRYYRVGAEISTTEQQIQHAKESRQRQRDELAQVEREHGETAGHIRSDRERLEALDATLAEDRPQQEQLRTVQDQSAAALQAAEEAMQAWQQQWEELNRRAAEPAQTAQVQRSRMEQLERHCEQARQRRAKIEQELEQLDPAEVEHEIEQLGVQHEQAAAEMTRLQGRLDANGEALEQARAEQAQAREALDEARAAQHTQASRVASLEALQQAALGQSDEQTVQWLERQGLAKRPRLAQQLQVEPGWERAVETVLGPFLEAVCVDRVDPVADALASLEVGSIGLIEGGGAEYSRGGTDGTLLARTNADAAAASMLARVLTARDVNSALSRRSGLRPGESIVTPDGVWIGPNWLRVARPAEEEGSVLGREQELAETRAELERARERVQAQERAVEQAGTRVRELEQEREQTQQALNRAHREHADLGSRLEGRRMRQEQLGHRRSRLQDEAAELAQQIEHEQTEIESARQARNRALEESESLEGEREQLQQQRERLNAELEQARERARSDRDAGHQVELRVEATRSSREATAQNLERMEQRLQQLEQRRDDLRAALANSDEPIQALEADLKAKLDQRVEVEREMNAARQRVEEIEQRMRALEQTRSEAEREAGDVRGQVENERMAAQEIRVRRQTVEEQLEQTGEQAATLLENLPDDADAADWEQQVADLTRRIERLGPVNLAAIDEHAEETKRKEYLDQQYDDVSQALETLENAIQKIDRETRSRFKQTFDTVNQQLQALFPRLFGGGQAYLEMTGDDLLSTGVTIMARPPGKRVSNIHLLSGGEKALTAVALVFALFELNPAPFCMLDEVDAPLDDANVGRYCELVREMSERVQFIFITHNKQTMELTNQLTGVTMREAGVSRLVAVDVQEAAAMAEA